MKIDRLIGILSILLQGEKITAPELAERFEVSRRTINRDIEALCKAGIPIRTAQGSGGGISQGKVNERLSHIIWCFDGRAGTFGAGVQIVRTTDYLS